MTQHRFIVSLPVVLLIFAGCSQSGPRAAAGHRQLASEETGAPLILILTSAVNSAYISSGVTPRTPNHLLLQGQVERFPPGAVLTGAVRQPGAPKWRILPAPAQVARLGEWTLSADLLDQPPSVETPVVLRVFITRGQPRDGDYSDAELREISVSQATDLTLTVTPPADANGRPGIEVEFIQEQAPQADRPSFTPVIFSISGIVHNVPPGVGIFVAGQCGDAGWRLLGAASRNQESWSVENATWPVRGRFEPKSCRVAAFARNRKPRQNYSDFASLSDGALVATGQFSVDLTPVSLEVTAMDSGSGEVALRDAAESVVRIPNQGPRAEFVVQSGHTPAPWEVYLALQPENSVRAFLFGPGKRLDDGHWLFDRVPLAFPGYPDAKTILVGAVVSDLNLQGRAVTQAEFAGVGFGYAPSVRIEAAPIDRRPSAVYSVKTVGSLPALPPGVALRGASSLIEGESAAENAPLPFIGQQSGGRWHFERASTIDGSRWSGVVEPVKSAALGFGPNGALVAVAGSDDLLSAPWLDDEWYRAFVQTSGPPVAVRLPTEPFLLIAGKEIGSITGNINSFIQEAQELDMSAFATFFEALSFLALLFATVLVFNLAGPRMWIWWHAFRDGRKDLPSSHHEGPAEKRIRMKSAASLARALRRTDGKIAGQQVLIENIESRLKRLVADLSKLQALAGRLSPDVHLSPRAAFWAGAIFTLGEFSLNLAGMDAFRQPFFHTILMALSVGVAVPFSARILGILLRQWPCPLWRSFVAFGVLTAGLAWIVWALTALRLLVLGGSDQAWLQQNPGLGAALIPVNIAVLIASAATVYLSLDEVPRYAEVHRQHAGLEAKYRREMARLRTMEARREARRNAIEAACAEALEFYRMINDRIRKTPRPNAPAPIAELTSFDFELRHRAPRAGQTEPTNVQNNRNGE